jgi:hypothetical protein
MTFSKVFFLSLIFLLQSAFGAKKLNIVVNAKERGLTVEVDASNTSFVIDMTASSVKRVRIMYVDCASSESSLPGSLGKCFQEVRQTVDPKERIELGFTKAISFEVETFNFDSKTLRPVFVNASESTLTVILSSAKYFSIFSYKMDRTARSFHVAVDNIKYNVNEADVLGLLQNLSTNQLTIRLSTEASSEKGLPTSVPESLSLSGGFLVICKKKTSIQDFRILQDSGKTRVTLYPKPVPPQVQFMKIGSSPNEFSLFRKSTIESPTSIRLTVVTRSAFVKETEIPLRLGLTTLEARLLREGGSLVEEVSLSKLKVNKPVILLSREKQNIEDAKARVSHDSISIDEDSIRVTIDESGLRDESQISFQVSQDQTGFQLYFSAVNHKGFSREKILAHEFKSSYKTIYLTFAENDAKSMRYLKLVRGMDLGAISKSKKFVSKENQGLESVWPEEIHNLCSEQQPVVHDFGWIQNLALSDVALENLDMHVEFESLAEEIHVFLFDSSQLILAKMSETAGASLRFEIPLQVDQTQSISISSKSLEGVYTTRNMSKPTFSMILPGKTPLVVALLQLTVRIGSSYFIKSDHQLKQILANSPRIELLESSSDGLDLAVYSQTDYLTVGISGNHQLTIHSGAENKLISTRNIADLYKTKLIVSTSQSSCSLPPSILVQRTGRPDENLLLVQTHGLDFSFSKLQILPNVSREFTFVQLLSSELSSLSSHQLESLFFNRQLSECQKPRANGIKFTLSMNKIIFHDPRSIRTVEYPIENFTRFSELEQVSFPGQDDELLYCLSKGQLTFSKFDFSVCVLKKGRIDDQEGTLRDRLFGSEATDLNMLDQPFFSIVQNGNTLELGLQDLSGSANVSISSKYITIAYNNELVISKEITDIQYKSSDTEFRYSKVEPHIFLFSFEPLKAQADSQTRGQNSLISKASVTSRSFDFKYKIRSNTDPEFIRQSIFEIGSKSISMVATYIEGENNSLYAVSYNSAVFQMLEVRDDQVYLQQKEARPPSLILKSISKTSSFNRRKDSLQAEALPIASCPNLSPSSNMICVGDECQRIHTFRSQTKGISYILIENDALGYFMRQTDSWTFETKDVSKAFKGMRIQVKCPSKTETPKITI